MAATVSLRLLAVLAIVSRIGIATAFVDDFFDNDNDDNDDDDDDDDDFHHKPKHGGCNWVWSKMDQNDHYKGGGGRGGGYGGYHKPQQYHKPPPYQHYGPKRYYDDEPPSYHQPYQQKKKPKKKQPLQYTHVPTNVKGPCEGPNIQKPKSHTVKANRDRSTNKKKVRADEGTHPYQDYLREQQEYQNRDYSQGWQGRRYH